MADVRSLFAVVATLLSACSGIQFLNHDDGHSHPYRVAMPALKVTTDIDCKMTSEVISIPGRLNYLKFKTGLGKIDDTVEFEPGGTIKKISANQSGVAEDLKTVLGAVKSAEGTVGALGVTEEQKRTCQPSVQIYPIEVDSSPSGVVVNKSQPLLDVAAHPAPIEQAGGKR